VSDHFRDRVAEAAQREIERRGHFAVVVPVDGGPGKVIAAFGPMFGPEGAAVESEDVVAAPSLTPPERVEQAASATPSPMAPPAERALRTFYVPRREALEKIRELEQWLDGLLEGGQSDA